MKKLLFENEKDPQTILDNLQGMCVKHEVMKYDKHFTPEELLNIKEEHSDESMALFEIEEEYDQVKAQFKERLDPHKNRVKSLKQCLKKKAETIEDTVYFIDDQEEKMMGIYDRNGELITARPLFPEERQLRINAANSI